MPQDVHRKVGRQNVADEPLERVITNFLGEKVRIAPCSHPDHVSKFLLGFAVVSCKECVMERIPLSVDAGAE